ncbi:MAG: M15 family metallopeptidase [Rhodocyclaceae bacterium]|nr:M15 family metallopeptidase [Rhodocyclaceae bacterium]MBX3669786.1 M15 family metallopeptidase [Rhodocyclaceae bacterium]
MTELSASVGKKGSNGAADVVMVQQLLEAAGFYSGAANGECDADTIDAIRRFQATFTANPDSLIEPGMRTWLRLNALAHLESAPPASPASAVITDWSGDSSQWTQEKKIASLNAAMRPKVQAVVSALAGRGFLPKIFFAWRSVAVQLEIVRKGHSKVKFSFHNAQLPDGTPNAYAADIIDQRWAWSDAAEQNGFWDALGEEAKKVGLFWGGDWKTFRDVAHVQLVDNPELARVKRESGL